MSKAIGDELAQFAFVFTKTFGSSLRKSPRASRFPPLPKGGFKGGFLPLSIPHHHRSAEIAPIDHISSFTN